GTVQLLSVSQANSSRIKLKMPREAADKVVAGFERHDPMLTAFLDDFSFLRVEREQPASGTRRPTSDVSEKGLETLIIRHMTGVDGLSIPTNAPAENPNSAGSGYFAGSPKDYDRAHALDVAQLFAFLNVTQPDAFKKLGMVDASDPKDINRLKILARLSSEIGKRGVIDVL